MNTTTLRSTLAAVGMATLAAIAAPSANAANVSISVNQPGVYGRINVGEPIPTTAWVRPAPVIIQQSSPVAYQRQPIYLNVPPAHYNQWARYCNRYDACGQSVVFVQDRWVREHYQREHYARPDRFGRPERLHPGGDRDHDGVRNRNDRFPNDPNWR